MKKINRIASKVVLTMIMTGLAAAVPLPGMSHRISTFARVVDRPSGTPPALQGEDAIRSLKEEGFYDSLQEAVRKAQYEVRWESAPAKGARPPGYHAPNPAQRYDAFFTPHGLSIAPRKTAPDDAASAGALDEATPAREEKEWQVEMKFIGYGYGESLLTAGAAALEAQGARIEYRRAWPPVVEWYANEGAGLEQGFTIQTPPGFRNEGERLRLVLELNSDLSAELTNGGQAVVLKDASGKPMLSYSGLYAFDARGRELPSQMKLDHGQVSLEVDDGNAVYPVTIDPVFNQQARLLHSGGGPNDFLGQSVAIYGETAVVGAHQASTHGSAYVFVRSNGVWGPPVELSSPNVSPNGQYGYSVAISGNTVVVGARFDTSGVYHGSAFVFERSGSTWGPPQKLEPSDSRASGWFGHSVAVSGTTIVVGAPLADVNGNFRQGSAVVFVRSGGAWVEQEKLFAGDGVGGNYFGYAVAVAGNTIVATAPWNSVFQSSCNCYRRQGAAYVFTRSYQNWSQQQKLSANDGEDDDRLGYSVAINSSWNTIVVGAPYDDISGRINQGSAYVFARNGSIWSQQWKLTAGGGAANDAFGFSVAVSGNEVVVGAPLDDVGVLTDQGSVYVYARSGSTWTFQGSPTSIDLWANHRFGHSVAISVGTIVAGAPFWDYWGYYAAHGAALVFVR